MVTNQSQAPLMEKYLFLYNQNHEKRSSDKKTVGNNAKRYYTTTKKLEIGDKPKSSASHGKILIVVSIFTMTMKYCTYYFHE